MNWYMLIDASWQSVTIRAGRGDYYCDFSAKEVFDFAGFDGGGTLVGDECVQVYGQYCLEARDVLLMPIVVGWL